MKASVDERPPKPCRSHPHGLVKESLCGTWSPSPSSELIHKHAAVQTNTASEPLERASLPGDLWLVNVPAPDTHRTKTGQTEDPPGWSWSVN